MQLAFRSCLARRVFPSSMLSIRWESLRVGLGILVALSFSTHAWPAGHPRAWGVSNSGRGASATAFDFYYQGKKRTLSDLPVELASAVGKSVDSCGAWAESQGYSLTLDPSGRVLLASERGGKKVKKELGLVKETLELVDSWIPEPVEFPKLWQKENGAQESQEWGWLGDPLREAIPIVFILKKGAHLESLLGSLAQTAPAIQPMLRGAGALSGFTLPTPLVTAYLESGAILEEYSTQHELVHRLTHLLMLQRAGRIPQWLLSGLCWEAEWGLGDGIWCFPWRDEFVFTVEHVAWPRLARDHAKAVGRKGILGAEDLFALQRRRFVRKDAVLAFGAASFLARKHTEHLSTFLRELAADRARGTYQDLGEYWNLDPSYTTSTERQLEILQGLVGEDVLKEVTAYLCKLR